jgi:hypothetical protein
MLKDLHNRLGENGEALTLLSLLDGPEFEGADEPITGTLREISERLRVMAGGDDTRVVSMYSLYPGDNGSLEFLALELLPLRQAIEQINQINRGASDAPTVMRVIGLDEDDAVDSESDESAAAEDGAGAVGHAVASLRDALSGLFHRAGENGQALTVLSLLSQPAPPTDAGSRPPTDTAADPSSP